MNGRCEKNALDRAEDICELCGDQFCASCLLYPRGHRNAPTCKGCALANSGLRGRGGSTQAIGKREYKKRKKTLLEQLEDVIIEAPALKYFDLADPSTSDRKTELDRRPEVIEEPETVDILGRLDDSAPPAEPAPEPGAADPAPPPPVAATTTADVAASPPPPPAPEPVQAFTGLAPVDTSVNPLAIGAPDRPTAPEPAPVPASVPTSGASATAAELLARLKADQPIQSQFTSPRSLEVDPFAAAAPHTPAAPQAGPPPNPGPAAAVATTNYAAAPTEQTQGISPTNDPFAPVAHSSAAPGNASPAPSKIQPWTPPAPPPRGTNLDVLDANETGTIDNPITPAPPAAAEPTPAPAPAAPAAAEPIAAPTAVPEALRPIAPAAAETEADPTPGRAPADTDDSGKWIPPSLRGMASAEERAADPLPKRR